MPAAFGSISVSSLTNQLTAAVLCPSGTVTNDLLLLFGLNDEPWPYNVPAGFTLLGQPTGTSADVGSGVYYKFATSGDVAGSTSYSMTESGGSGVQPNIAACLRYTGVSPTLFPGTAFNPSTNNPSVYVGLTHGTTTTAANAACPAPTNPSGTLGANDILCRLYMSGDDAAATGKTLSAVPANWTQRGSYVSNVSGKFNVGMIACDRTGSMDTATVTSNLLSMWDVYTILIPALTSTSPMKSRARRNIRNLLVR